jgi:hypothetical protein
VVANNRCHQLAATLDAEPFEDHVELAPIGAVAEVHRLADLGGRMSLRFTV